MNTLIQRKLAVVFMAFAMVFTLSRVLTLALRAGLILPDAPILSLPRMVHRKKDAPLKMYAKKKIAIPHVEANVLHMNSTIQEYNVIFAGQVHCTEQPCIATVEFLSTTPRNENLHRSLHTMDDGSFWVQVPLSEVNHEHLDWKITARLEDGRTAEKHGRDILSEDTVVSIDATLTPR